MRSLIAKQRLSYSEKKKDDFQWAKTFMKSIIRYHEEDFCVDCKDNVDTVNNQTRRVKNMLANYRLFNNQLDQADFKEYCDALGVKEEIEAVVHDIKPYNKTHNKINVLLGEEYKRPDNQRVVLVNAEGIKSKIEYKNKLYRDYINSQVEQVVQQARAQFPELTPESFQSQEEYDQAMQEQEAQVQQIAAQVMNPEEIEKYMASTYLDQKEILAGDLLKYMYFKENLKEKKNDGFKHGLISGEEHVWVGVINGEPMVELLNPLKMFYHKSAEVKYIQNGLYAGYRTHMAIHDVLDNYAEMLTDKQKDLLEERFSSNIEGADASLISPSMKYGDMETMEFKFSDREPMYEGSYGRSSYDDVEVVHMEWVSQRKIAWLSTIDPESGEVSKDIVSEEIKIPKYAVKTVIKDEYGNNVTRYQWDNYYLEWDWLPEVWEGTQIDGDIYVNIGPKINQYYSDENPYKVKLGYHGVIYNNMNAPNQSAMDRMKPFQYLFFITMDKFKKLIAQARNQSTAIDTSRLDPKFPIEKTIHFLEEAGYYVYNGLQGGDVPGASTRPGIDAIPGSNIGEIINFAQILAYFDKEIGEAVGVSPQREGGVSPYEAVTNAQQAITQSSHITEPIFSSHEHLWREVKNSMIETAELAYRDNPFVTQFVLNDGSRNILEITPELFRNAVYGIFVTDNNKEYQVFEELRGLVQPMIQSDRVDMSDIIDILTADSTQELKRELKDSESRRFKREQSAQEAQAQQEQQAMEMQHQMQERQFEHEKELEMMKTERELTKSEIEAARFALAQDVNENNVPDAVEVAKVKQEGEQADKDRAHESKENEKDRQVEREKIAAQKVIAKSRPKPSSK